MKLKLKLDELISHLGEPEKHVGDEYFWQCPYCKDSHRDNLKFNEVKGVLWCFANDSHAPQVLKDMFSNNHFEIPRRDINFNENCAEAYILANYRQDEFEGRMDYANHCLLSDENDLAFLLAKRGITRKTVENVKLGLDPDGYWRIPTFAYSIDGKRKVIGFEYRPRDLSKVGLHREKNTPTGLAMINEYTALTQALVIVEGYFDGYALWQNLDEQGKADYFHILTPSNGVNSLYKYIPQINFSEYQQFFLFLDQDEAGQRMTSKILETYPMFEPITLSCGCKDFNEHYLKCIKEVV